MYRRLFILVIAAFLAVCCSKEEKQELDQKQQELFDLKNVQVPDVPDPQIVEVQADADYGFSFDAERYGVDAGSSVSVGYSLPEASTLEVIVKDGWSAVVNSSDEKSGTIVVTAPDPASPSEIVVKATTADGLNTAAVLPIVVRDPYTDATRTDIAALAYNALYRDIATDYHFQMMAECGMNMLSIEYADNWREQLSLCEKHGLKGVLFVNGPAGQYYISHGEDLTIDAVINEAKTYPALAAYQIFDEPKLAQIGQIVFEKNRIEELDPDHPVYVNLHPGSASEGSLGVDDYFEYVEEMVTRCNLKFITFDQYPVFVYGIDAAWHKSLVAVRTSALKHNIPFWAFTLCCREWEREDPTLENIRLQCNTNLIFGAQVNQFFVYRSTSGTEYAPLQTWEWIDKENDKKRFYSASEVRYTAAYDDCKAYCREMHNRGFVFSGCNVKKVCNTNIFNNWVENLNPSDLPDCIKKLSTGDEALVSFIENKGNEYIAVVNSLWRKSQTVSLELNDMVYMIDHDGVFTELDRGKHDVVLEGGDMMVLKIK